MQEVSCGVPQDTLVRPLLFIIFINDLLKFPINLYTEILSFTEDTSILLSKQTIDTLYYKANKTLNNIITWFCKDNISVSVHKCVIF